MSKKVKSIIRTILLAFGTFCVTALPYLTIESSWSEVARPFVLLAGLSAAAFTVAAGLSSSPTESAQTDDLLAISDALGKRLRVAKP